ncbi:MAG TPA: TIGR03032 family protein [Isosphaeraceae bacterium]|jgi:uncharacterized protein (TIGR03032 family)
MDQPAPAPAAPHPGARAEVIRCDVSGAFPQWIGQAGGSVAITTYQAGKVALIGWDGQQVTALFRDFEKPMGLAVAGSRLLLATRHQVLLFADAPALAREFLQGQPGRYDALYLPRVAYLTGDLNVHEVAFGAEGLWLVNTRFSCLAAPSAEYCFVPRWRPPFVSAVAPEDRCHLNGLAMAEGRPRFVTALAPSDEVGGWRPVKADGGVVIDVPADEVVLRGLCMPHSPRLHDGALWVLNSGAGELWRVELGSFRREVVCALPGYLRGLCFVGPFALIGLSQIRERHIFGGLPVQARHPRLRCRVAVIDTRTGAEVGGLDFTAGCTELFDVQFLPGVRRPMIVGPEKEAARQAFPAPGSSYWLRPSAQVPVPPGRS